MLRLKTRVGKIIIPGGTDQPEPHEYAIADLFARGGKDVEFIKPSRIKGSRSPDIKMNGLLWEIKSPTGNGKYTVQAQLKRAARQSKNIIFDSRRSKLKDSYIEKELHRQMTLSKSLRRLILISKKNQIIEIKR